MDYVSLYRKEQTEVEYNKGDKVLAGQDGSKFIKVKLPTVESFFGKSWEEAIKEIDGYGMPPNKQKYDTYRNLGYYDMPPKLVAIKDKLQRSKKAKDSEKKVIYPDEYFDEIESNPVEYKEEIAWIKTQINRSHDGYWCFINGQPTYIDGWHYTYLNYTKINNDKRPDRLPFYRDVDRRIFLFLKWAYTTTETVFRFRVQYRKGSNFEFKYFNNKTNAHWFAKTNGIKPDEYIIEEGNYIVDVGHRTVFGVVFPKRRRVGATYMGSHVGTRITVDNSMGTMAIQALTEETALDDVYKGKIMKPFSTYPFFLKPTHGIHTTSQLLFEPRKGLMLGDDIVPHGGWIIPRSSSNKAFDGNKLFFYLNDESGKKERSDILFEFRDTIKNALAQGEDIHGFAMYTSTFGEFEKGGGREYFELCRKSLNHVRDDNGFTQTGLVTLFVPAYDGFDGYVDEFGFSVIEDPEIPFVNMEGKIKTEGAKTMLSKKRKFLEEMQDWEGLAASARNEPFDLKEASSKAARSNFWDMSILRERIAYLTYENTTHTWEVNLKWNGERMSEVLVETPPLGERGNWIVSYLPSHEDRNKMIWDENNNYYKPQIAYSGRYVLGCDPFMYNEKDTVGRKKSKGGGAMFMNYDPIIDPKDKMEEKITERFVATFSKRTETVEEYVDEMLKAAVLFNAHVNPETNVDHVVTKFREWGAGGYLMYMTDGQGMLSKVAGIRTTPEVKQKIFSAYGDYIKSNGHREKHVELLNEVSEVESFDDMTDNDLFAAGGMALLGATSRYVDIIRQDDNFGEDTPFVELYD